MQVKPKLTYDDYANFPGDERYQLIDGELILLPTPNLIHQHILKKLILLSTPADRPDSGRIYIAPFDVVLSDNDVVQPDMIFISKERMHILTHANVQGAPDLVIEILLPSTADLDRTQKRDLYERHGVKEMWLIDPAECKVTVLRLNDNTPAVFETAGEYTAGQSFTCNILDGLTIAVDNVFDYRGVPKSAMK